ncbi:hypothetical protein V6615_07355 [Oscillospiraceae bacterium PP1C4]
MGNTNKTKKPVREAKLVESVQYRKNKYAAPVGGIFIFLAVLGLIALTVFCVDFTRSLLDNSKEKQKFEQIILPVLMFDPVPFEKAADANPLFLLQTSLWSTLLGEKRDSYQFDAMNRLIVPASDVDVTCAKLFGPDVKLEHQSFGDYETSYVYDESTKTYYAMVASQTGMYTPSVERVVKKGDVFTLTVGYVPPANAWTQGLSGETKAPEPDKRMIYELLKVKDHFQLMAIRDLPPEAIASGDAASAVQNSLPSQSKP